MAARTTVRQAKTQYGYQLASLAFTPTAGVLGQIEDIVENVTIRREMVTQEGHALKDVGEYPVPVRERTTLEFTLMVEDTCPFIEYAHAADPTGTVVLTPYLAGKKWTGKFLITSAEHAFPDGPQTIRVSMVSQGAVTFAA